MSNDGVNYKEKLEVWESGRRGRRLSVEHMNLGRDGDKLELWEVHLSCVTWTGGVRSMSMQSEEDACKRAWRYIEGMEGLCDPKVKEWFDG